MYRTSIVLLACAVLAACASARPAPRAARRVGQPIALVAPALDGREVRVEADQGRVRVVDFWATWCVPCRDELPALDALQKELGADLEVFAVSFDEDKSQIPRFLELVPLGIQVLWDKGGSAYASRYDVNRLPTTLIVDRRGIIRFVHEGYDDATARQQRREIERLLAERSAAAPERTAGEGPSGR